jgi:predicted dehydrogenase
MSDPTPPAGATRRQFVQTAAAAAASALTLDCAVYAAGSDVLRLGLIGCGARGTGAAAQALKADPHTRVVALGDVFADQIPRCLNLLRREEGVANRVEVPAEHCFVGFDAYKQVIASDVDVVLLAAPPHFRPLHLAAAVEAGKHVFAEKPVAVDAPGVRKVLAACEQAKAKNLSIGSGLCWRYEFAAREGIKRIHDGAIGDVVTIQSNYIAAMPGKRWPMERKPEWSDMEWQLRNWYWWTWLSGDHIVEQAVHSIDKGAWALHDRPPAAAVGVGGLQSRSGTGPERGQIFDHHAVAYEYANGVRHFHCCRQVNGGSRDVSTHVFGTKGSCHVELGLVRDLGGAEVSRYRGKKNVMHQTEHDEQLAALRAGKPVNDGPYMAASTMLAILGRMATYTAQRVTWDQALNSKEDLTPPHYQWGSLPTPTPAVPGKTKVV